GAGVGGGDVLALVVGLVVGGFADRCGGRRLEGVLVRSGCRARAADRGDPDVNGARGRGRRHGGDLGRAGDREAGGGGRAELDRGGVREVRAGDGHAGGAGGRAGGRIDRADSRDGNEGVVVCARRGTRAAARRDRDVDRAG